MLVDRFNQSSQVNLTPYRKFRVIAICIYNFLALLNRTKKFKVQSINEIKQPRMAMYIMTLNTVKTWIIDCLQHVFRSVILDK